VVRWNDAALGKWIARNILQDIRDNSNMSPKEFDNLIYRKYNVSVGHEKSWRAREI